jgi:sterol desaturase/sphingolipid hydroxylase (fatty acid hydroxylase superfamily)
METCNQCHGEGKIKHNIKPKEFFLKKLWNSVWNVHTKYLSIAIALIPSIFLGCITLWMGAAKLVYWLANAVPSPTNPEGMFVCAMLGVITGGIASVAMGVLIFDLWDKNHENHQLR